MGNSNDVQSNKEIEKQIKIFNNAYQGKGSFRLTSKLIREVQKQVLFEYPFLSNVFGDCPFYASNGKFIFINNFYENKKSLFL